MPFITISFFFFFLNPYAISRWENVEDSISNVLNCCIVLPSGDQLETWRPE